MKIKTLDDVIDYLTNVAEFELLKPIVVSTPTSNLTMANKNYEDMYDVIDWIENNYKEGSSNEN